MGGNVGIGTTTPTAAGAGYVSLTLNGSTSSFMDIRSNNSGVARLQADNANSFGIASIAGASGYIHFDTNGSERARIAADGTFTIGTTSLAGANLLVMTNSSATGYGISVSCNSSDTTYRYFEGFSSSAGAQKIAIYTDGNVRIAVGSTYANFSDAKLKTNIVDATSKLADVCALKVRNFSSIEDPNSKYIGFIAQEVEEVFPSLVFSQEDTDRSDGKETPLGTYTKGVKESALIAVLTKAIQELSTKLDAAEARIASLEGAN